MPAFPSSYLPWADVPTVRQSAANGEPLHALSDNFGDSIATRPYSTTRATAAG